MRLARFKTAARRNILARYPVESLGTVDALLDKIADRAADARTVIDSAAYLEQSFDSQLADDAAQLGAELAATAPELRRKIAFVHACVEQAAREGRNTRDVLAERIPP